MAPQGSDQNAPPPSPGAPMTPEQMAAMMMMPAAPAPSGVTPNFDNPESRADMTIAVCTVILAIMLISVSLRVYARTMITKTFGWEDWTCVIAAILNVGYVANAFVVLQTGTLGVHQYDLRIGTLMTKTYFASLTASQSLYPVVLLFTKLSILLLVMRIFWSVKAARYFVWFGIFVNTVFYFITFVLTVVWCAPPAGGDPIVYGSKPSCQTDVHIISVVQSGFNIGSDLYLVLIPIPLVAGLKMSHARKFRVSFVFALGLLATVLSAINLYYRVLSLRTTDVTWIYTTVYITSIYELNIGVVCVCLPCFPAIFRTERMKNFMSLRSWSFLKSSFSTSRSKIWKPRSDKGDYSDMTSLKDDKSKGDVPSVTANSMELRDVSPASAGYRSQV
ncbi:hypothetical protein EJ04DRAFT_516204 [Polyplosphaeria fusca]|uniref:Rhodopsin domain-containing protein n=1 Tax=Polyplosphaeria fusca TaxID=682080 RepID=A0A9P4QNX0_9PLEO|nr:hypothetical protein EJ04DRAFT_516204 [Polyplosphaeria fusca]